MKFLTYQDIDHTNHEQSLYGITLTLENFLTVKIKFMYCEIIAYIKITYEKIYVGPNRYDTYIGNYKKSKWILEKKEYSYESLLQHIKNVQIRKQFVY